MTYPDWLIERQLTLLRIAASEDTLAQQHIDELEQEIKDYVSEREFKRNTQDAIVTAVAIWALSGLGSAQRRRFVDLSKAEITATTKVMGLTSNLAGLDNVFIQGASYADWLKKSQQATRFTIAQTIRLGITQGDSGAQLFERLKPVIEKARREITALTTTATFSVANAARQKVYESVANTGDMIQHLSILDNKTSIVCFSRSGLRWRLPDYTPIGHKQEFRLPPLHIACRSTVLFVRKGEEPNVPTFTEFMDKRPDFAESTLGKGRYQLFKTGKISQSQLLDPKTLKPLTIEELRTL